jgi:uncharacterized small protein (DUF1192 family)
MTCKELQYFLYSTKIKDLGPAEKEFLKKHLVDCEECKFVFEEVSKADRILAKVKDTIPRIRNEHVLAESIIAKIVSDERTTVEVNANKFLDRLITIFSMKAVRFACSIVILLCGMTYLFMEYNDMKSIVNLEQRLGIQHDFSRASIILPGVNVPGFLYDFYGLSNGDKAYIKLTNKLILMKKENLQALLNGYKTLDKESRKRLDEIQDQFLKDEYLKFSSTKKNEEIEKLQNEIERLKKELEQSNHKEKRQ